MAERISKPPVRITKRIVDSLAAGEARWDSEIKGFGVRRLASGRRVYVFKCRVGRGRKALQRWVTIGTHGSPWTPEAARIEAKSQSGRVADGEDPSVKRRGLLNAVTVSELCDDYLKGVESGVVRTRSGGRKRASTVYVDRGRIERHIKPLLGTKAVKDVTSQDVAAFIANVAAGKTATSAKTERKRGLAIVTGGDGAATRTVGLLGAIFTYAIETGLRSDNPTRGAKRPQDGKKDRRLDADEYRSLGKALEALDEKQALATAAVRLLALTGMRKGEALGLRRTDVEEKRRLVRMRESKTGESVRPLGKAALAVIASVPKVKGSPYVFPATAGRGHYVGLPKTFETIRTKAGLEDVTLHTLRHSFASVAAELGYSEPTIAAMLGHATRSMTGRYIHFIDGVLIAAADRVSQHILDLMSGTVTTGEVLPLVRAQEPST